jgi:hypothetical protein
MILAVMDEPTVVGDGLTTAWVVLGGATGVRPKIDGGIVGKEREPRVRLPSKYVARS